MENLENKVEKVMEQRNLSRKKMMEIVEKIIEISEKNSVKKEYEIVRLKYSNAYSGCYEKFISIGKDNEGDDIVIAVENNDNGWLIIEPTLKNENRSVYLKRNDYGCQCAVKAKTSEMKKLLIKQIENIKKYEDYEAKMLQEIKDILK